MLFHSLHSLHLHLVTIEDRFLFFQDSSHSYVFSDPETMDSDIFAYSTQVQEVQFDLYSFLNDYAVLPTRFLTSFYSVSFSSFRISTNKLNYTTLEKPAQSSRSKLCLHHLRLFRTISHPRIIYTSFQEALLLQEPT